MCLPEHPAHMEARQIRQKINDIQIPPVDDVLTGDQPDIGRSQLQSFRLF
jgi:hypothetical protein